MSRRSEWRIARIARQSNLGKIHPRIDYDVYDIKNHSDIPLANTAPPNASLLQDCYRKIRISSDTANITPPRTDSEAQWVLAFDVQEQNDFSRFMPGTDTFTKFARI